MADSRIIVRSLGDGDFEVVQGGEIYRRWNGQTVPGEARVGERVSAAEVCEWEACGTKVEERS